MNNFVTINKVQSFKKVTYYTISLINDLDLFTQFINKFSFSNAEKINLLLCQSNFLLDEAKNVDIA